METLFQKISNSKNRNKIKYLLNCDFFIKKNIIHYVVRVENIP